MIEEQRYTLANYFTDKVLSSEESVHCNEVTTGNLGENPEAITMAMDTGNGSGGVQLGFNHHTINLPIGPLSRQARLALDIGGSLAKLAYIAESNNNEQSKEIEIHLVTFDAEKISDIIDFINNHVLIGTRNGKKPIVYGTGVGCTRHYKRLAEGINIHLETDQEEMDQAAQGLSFLWKHLTLEELFYPESDLTDLCGRTAVPKAGGLRKYCLTNVGSALTIHEVDENSRVSGVIGGGITAGLTFLGLGALLTRCSNFDELMKLADSGCRQNVDLYVSDTAGASYNVAPPEAMVSSFGRVAKVLGAQNQEVKFNEGDLAASLLYGMVDQLAATSYLVAKCHNLEHMVVVGSFIGNNQKTRQQFQEKTKVCTSFLKHNVRPLFVRYESYLGALGALTRHAYNV